ncbi:MAG TPA: hypothetical protein VGF80_00275 [Galbitalea sp.]
MKRTGAGILLLAALGALLAGCSSPVPNPASISAAQRKAATQADLDDRWKQVQPGNPTYLRPSVAIIRYVNYLDEGPVLAKCMRDSGYPHVAWSLKGGIIDTDVKPVDRFPVEVAIYICEAQYPSDPLELGYLSNAQQRYLYQYWGDETVPCLRAHGAIVPNVPPITQFGEGYEDVAELNPFDHATRPDGISESYLLTACPPYPGQLYAEHK